MESGWFKQDEHGIQARTCLPQLMHIRVRETLGDIGQTEPKKLRSNFVFWEIWRVPDFGIPSGSLW